MLKVKETILKAYKPMVSLFLRLNIQKIPGTIFFHHIIWKFIKPKRTVEINHRGNKMLVSLEDSGPGNIIFFTKNYEEFISELIEDFLEPGMTFVDAGANIGYHSLTAARSVGSSGSVFAFEPEKKNVDLLKKNVALNNYENVSIIEKALSNKTSKTKLFIDKANFGAHSIMKSRSFMRKALEIETITLDKFFSNSPKNIDLLKIDVEGAEILVLEGAEKILDQDKLKIIFEISPYISVEDKKAPFVLLQNLRKKGFTIKFIDTENRILKPINNPNKDSLKKAVGLKKLHTWFNLLAEK